MLVLLPDGSTKGEEEPYESEAQIESVTFREFARGPFPSMSGPSSAAEEQEPKRESEEYQL